MKNLKKTFTKLASISAVFVSRLGFLPANFSPVGSLGFFSDSPLPLLMVTLGFDLWRGGFYSGFSWTYLGFFSYWLMGWLARQLKIGEIWQRQALLLPVASFSFFLISNFGVWLSWYPHTLAGLVGCYTLALPFYLNTLLGDLVFGWGWLLVINFAKILRATQSVWDNSRICRFLTVEILPKK